MSIPALREIIEERKQQAVETLSASYAKNRLPLEEYERLVEYINKIESERELAVVEKIVAEYGGNDTGEPAAADDEDYGRESYQNNQSFLSNMTILSSRSFTGPVKSGSQFVNILGSEHIKIRKNDLSRQKTVLDAVSILGEIVILVEPGIRVTNNAIPVLGGAWTDNKIEKQARNGDPEIIITGAALLGNITVKLLKD